MKRKYESQSSSLSSTNKGIQESREPCEVCGSVGIEDLIMTCFKCRVTREHTYCARVSLPSVPPMWLCEACRFSSRVLLIDAVAEDLMDIETGVADCSLDPKNSNNSREEDHESARLRTNDTEEGVSLPVIRETSNVSSVNHAPSQPHTSPVAKEASSVLDDSTEGKELHQLLQAFPKKPRNFRLMGKKSHKTDSDFFSGPISNRNASQKCKPKRLSLKVQKK